jgi:hypothetical protein
MKKTLSILLCIFCFTALGISQEQQTQTRVWQEEQLAEIKKRIEGRENEPAEKVFQNIEILKGKPASRLPGMMSAFGIAWSQLRLLSYSKSLGRRR